MVRFRRLWPNATSKAVLHINRQSPAKCKRDFLNGARASRPLFLVLRQDRFTALALSEPVEGGRDARAPSPVAIRVGSDIFISLLISETFRVRSFFRQLGARFRAQRDALGASIELRMPRAGDPGNYMHAVRARMPALPVRRAGLRYPDGPSRRAHCRTNRRINRRNRAQVAPAATSATGEHRHRHLPARTGNGAAPASRDGDQALRDLPACVRRQRAEVALGISSHRPDEPGVPARHVLILAAGRHGTFDGMA